MSNGFVTPEATMSISLKIRLWFRMILLTAHGCTDEYESIWRVLKASLVQDIRLDRDCGSRHVQ